MPPVFVPPLVKWALAAIGGAAILHWAAREIRRVNEEIERARAAASMDAIGRKELPTLRRDPATGVWRLV
jgi:hypothetical protein